MQHVADQLATPTMKHAFSGRELNEFTISGTRIRHMYAPTSNLSMGIKTPHNTERTIFSQVLATLMCVGGARVAPRFNNLHFVKIMNEERSRACFSQSRRVVGKREFEG